MGSASLSGSLPRSPKPASAAGLRERRRTGSGDRGRQSSRRLAEQGNVGDIALACVGGGWAVTTEPSEPPAELAGGVPRNAERQLATAALGRCGWPEVAQEWLADCHFAVHTLKSAGLLMASEVDGVVLITLGLLRTESNFGRSKRYRVKRLIQTAAQLARVPMHLAIGEAQVSPERVGTLRLLFPDVGRGLGEMPWGRRESALAAAMGLAVAVGLYNPTRQPLDLPLARVLAITHNSGWLGPRNAALQRLLTDLQFLAPEGGLSGFCGTETQSALLRAASEWHIDPPSWLTFSPSRFRFLMHAVEHYTDVFESELIVRCRESWKARFHVEAPDWVEPNYSFHPWHGGWIRSASYARSVTELFAKRSVNSD